ncbi:16S rRNA (cytosine(967)-C(5))-methyltransferase RsmB [Caballeronia insecticola]|uniref:Fmu rRNA SAM-dependent methyltransferase n=1 Tax=Caballeronia insecticola TaxID=758793 RepID=R4WLU3_9BURK|nr:16S rRNA (cytosine(967)-C(5))-methyltransferase RsmB [Caballeronia insecticola]BAN21785.1 Fmu rRNA SAM-dependent methyltransferase [Caballeronia insecticola]
MTDKPPRRHTAAHPRLSALRLAPDSLAFALDCAAQAVGAVRAGSALPAALQTVVGSGKLAVGRGAVQDIAYRTMRRLALADALLHKLVKKAPPPHVSNVLVCAFTLLTDDEANAAYAPFTVVDQAVGAIAARREFAFAKGLVNAVLRNFLRERDALIEEACASPVVRWNYPQWWIDAVRRAQPDAWERILEAGNVQGPLTLRVNARHTSVDAYLDRLRTEHIDADAAGLYAVRLETPMSVDRIPGFAEGVVSVQDAGAQFAAQLLDAQDGMRVLDACAAPGGKTGHILELANVDLIALESDAERATRIEQNLTRLKLQAQIEVGDAGDPSRWFDGKPFDRILADVPCSASGIVRRHPDIRWLRRESDIAALVDEQRRILSALWPLVAKGGELLYVTCSVFPEEGEEQARWFGAAHEDAVRLDAPGQLLPTAARASSDAAQGSPDGTNLAGPAAHEAPGAGQSSSRGARAFADHDGFFYARFQKR